MKIKKRIDGLQIVSVMMFFISLVCLIITGLEGPIVEESYQFPGNFIDKESDSAWGVAVSTALKNYQVDLRYPARPWYGEPFIIQAAIKDRDGKTNSNSNAGTVPSFILDTNLDMDSVKVNPAKRILLPIHLPQTGFVQWEIAAASSAVKSGRIWISLLPVDDANTAYTSVPVLVLPVEIEMRAILGLRVWVWRGVWVGLGIAGIGLFVFWRIKKVRHI
jgi:hypothetical protein